MLKDIKYINPYRLGRSRSFDSIESLKDKEECKEIVNLEKERLATQKAQKTKNHLQPHYSLRKISLISDKHKLNDKMKYNIASKVSYNENKYPLKIGSSPCTSNENYCNFQKNNMQDIPSTSDINKIEAKRILHVQTILDAQALNQTNNLQSSSAQNIGLWMKGTALKIEGNDTYKSKLCATSSQVELFKQSNDEEVNNLFLLNPLKLLF